MSDDEYEKNRRVPLSKLKTCKSCHCRKEVEHFIRLNFKGTSRREFQYCNKCILKSRNKSNEEIKCEEDDDKKFYDNVFKKISPYTIENGKS